MIRDGILELHGRDRAGDNVESTAFSCPATAATLIGDDLVVAVFPTSGLIRGYDLSGALRFEGGAPDGLEEPSGVSAAPDGTGFLVADARRHIVLHFPVPFRSRPPRRVTGRPGWAGKQDGLLNAPRFAAFTSQGTVLVTDTKNNRLLEFDGDRLHRSWGMLDSFSEPSFRLWYPNTAVMCDDGSLLVAEGRGGRLLQIAPDGGLVELHGSAEVTSTEIIQPRGGHFAAPDRIVVTDSHNCRVLALSPDGQIHQELPPPTLREQTNLDWPRFAVQTPEGTVVADGRNGRLTWLDHDGRVKQSLHDWRLTDASEPVPFVDPHHISVIKGSTDLLITDSGAGSVVRLRIDGTSSMSWHGFNDPHMALALGDEVLVCDTGAHRVVRVAVDGTITWSINAEQVSDLTGIPLRHPRAIAVLEDERMLIVDTGNHRLLLAARNGDIRSLADTTTRLAGSLYFPRFISVDSAERTALISDFDNSRLVFMDLNALLGGTDD
ncbi:MULTISPECIES: NHL repeat-containing protein [Catenuloplanes]|uniref:Sugar lactone lactonase YvrE n=1 Tax=Catenuloplanes niger TaxID=587534 RepID=A0AAE3ZVV0_9ACTN|nr:hypothetical protein [Catenuloplanes niger]MDR7326761.1 sugar lactone lactonase YvrE [Catenuloplanes niger]